MSEPFSPVEQLNEGANILRPLLEPAGFKFALTNTGKGSGGQFAVGEFTRGDRRLELHYRYGLGIANYHVGGPPLSHNEFMRAQGAEKTAAFPTVLDKSLRGFHALLADLESHGSAFLDADPAPFLELAKWCAANPRKTGFKALSD